MFKSTYYLATILSVILLSFSSCSEDSQADKWVGDDYIGSFVYALEMPAISDVYEEVSISADGDNISVNFKAGANNLTGTIDEFDQVEMDDYNLTIEDGSTLALVNGSGKFELNSNNAEQVEKKILSVTYQLKDNDQSLCVFAFGEM